MITSPRLRPGAMNLNVGDLRRNGRKEARPCASHLPANVVVFWHNGTWILTSDRTDRLVVHPTHWPGRVLANQTFNSVHKSSRVDLVVFWTVTMSCGFYNKINNGILCIHVKPIRVEIHVACFSSTAPINLLSPCFVANIAVTIKD